MARPSTTKPRPLPEVWSSRAHCGAGILPAVVQPHPSGCGEPCSLAEVSRHIGLSRERVRQLAGRALEQLRQSQDVQQLMAFLDSEDREAA